VRVLLTGAQGQLGKALRRCLPEGIELIATARQADAAVGVLPLDLSDRQACRSAVLDYRPDWVLNAGAYTAVDQAESEPQLAQAVNAGAPGAFAEALLEIGSQGRLLQVSTDFVFNGQQGHPYRPDQSRAPLGVYGATKAAGEQVVTEILGINGVGRASILRTSWVYGPVGRNFLLTMLKLHRQQAERGEPLRVVADQVGCPTATSGLAAACWAVVHRRSAGVLHWSDAGVASWYDFALAIGALAQTAGLLETAAEVQPITSADYPTPARRPSYSLLDCAASRTTLGLPVRHWSQVLHEVIADVGQ